MKKNFKIICGASDMSALCCKVPFIFPTVLFIMKQTTCAIFLTALVRDFDVIAKDGLNMFLLPYALKYELLILLVQIQGTYKVQIL